MKFTDLRVRTKLMLGFAVIAAIVLGLSALSLHSLGASNARFADYLSGVGARERLATDIRGAATRRAIAARNLVLVTEPGDVALEKAAVLKAHDEVGVALDKLKAAVGQATDVTARDHELLAEIGRVESLYGPVATDSVDKVDAGTQLVGEAGSTMNDVVSQVRRMTDLMGEINASSAEQTSGIVQVNSAVASIDNSTQQNTALVEESAAAAESLKLQAASLLGLVAAFKTADTRQAAFA